MSINYNLEIVSMEVYPHTGSYDNVVYNVFSRYWATADNGVKDLRPLATAVEMPQENFIPYDQLTNEIVSGWVTSAVDIPALQAELAASIAQKSLPPTSEILPVPWNN
jgi:hypothetical protein